MINIIEADFTDSNLSIHMQPDGDDIRFTTGDKVTEIPYWIESGINTTSTIIWVKVPSIPTGDSTIYLYYSNPGASTASSAPNTFGNGSFQDLFDDISKLDADDSSGGLQSICGIGLPSS